MENENQDHDTPESIDNVISWLNDDNIRLWIGELWFHADIVFAVRDGSFRMYFSMRGSPEERLTGYLLCHNANDWGRLGNAFGSRRNIKSVHIRTGGGLPAEGDNSYQCVEAFFAGLEKNKSIENIYLDIVWLLNDPYPSFNLRNVQFKTNLKLVYLLNELKIPITFNQCQIISVCFEGLMSTANHHLFFGELSDTQEGPLNANIFQRLLDACSNLHTLRVHCLSPSHCSAVALFLRGANTVKLTVELSNTLGPEHEATIIHGLRENTSLRFFHLEKQGFFSRSTLEYDPHGHLAKALCDSSSIDNIFNSNHTLTEVYPGFESSDSESSFQLQCEYDIKVAHCLEMNKNTDKNKVIREKIANYYFVGEFDVSIIARLPVTVVPSILHMIRGDKLERQSAIFRLLKSIPSLCNVGSRPKIVASDY